LALAQQPRYAHAAAQQDFWNLLQQVERLAARVGAL
jgi:hypothetical protein